MSDKLTKIKKNISIVNILKYVNLLYSFYFIFLFLTIAVLRFNYSFELEWMEGGILQHVVRILEGQPLYCEPSLEYVPFRYAPLYYYMSGLFSLIIGISFTPLRLVSIISTIGIFFYIYQFVIRETRQKSSAIMAVGFYAATFSFCGSWFDLARIDSLFIFFLLSGIFHFYYSQHHKNIIISGLLFTFAIFTKQLAIPIIIFIFLWGLISNRRKAIIASGITILLTFIITSFFNIFTHGMFYFYMFELGGKITPRAGYCEYLWDFMSNQLFHSLPIMMILSLVTLVYMSYKTFTNKGLFFILFTISMIGATYLTRIQPGGWTNTFMTSCVALAILSGICISYISKNTEKSLSFNKSISLVVMHLLIIFQFSLLLYNPKLMIPSEQDHKAGMELISIIKNYNGDVLIPYHGYLGYMANKKYYHHFQATRDFSGERGSFFWKNINTSIKTAIKNKKFDAIILDRDWYIREVSHNYNEICNIFDKRSVFYPVTGWGVRPEKIYHPK
ncbi:MAG: ArnT family glycosyltransferase [Methanosarcinaceae archaeon]